MIPLYIPFVNRRDLLDKAVASARVIENAVHVIDNSTEGINDTFPPFHRLRPVVPLTFAQTQNWMLAMAAETNPPAPFYLFMHSDAEAGEGTVQKLIDMAYNLSSNRRKWGAIFTAYDALAAFNTAAFRHVGGWDQYLEWYCSDNDMYHRLRLAGYEIVESGLPVEHTPSQTLNSDSIVRLKVDLMVPCRQAYYAAKWGGAPGNEIYATPFNRPAL